MNFYNVPTVWTAAEAHIDLQAGRYLVMGLFNESRVHDFTVEADRGRLHARRAAAGRACGSRAAAPARRRSCSRPASWRPPRSTAGSGRGMGRDGAARAPVAAARRRAQRRAAAGGRRARAHPRLERRRRGRGPRPRCRPARCSRASTCTTTSSAGPWATTRSCCGPATAASTWERVHHAPEDERPLLDVWFADAERGLAIGAYGELLATSDGGDTWETRAIREGDDFHLNQIAAARTARSTSPPRPATSTGPTTAARPGWRCRRPTRARSSACCRSPTARCSPSGCAATCSARPTAARRWTRIETATEATLMSGAPDRPGALRGRGHGGHAALGRERERAAVRTSELPDRKAIVALAPGAEARPAARRARAACGRVERAALTTAEAQRLGRTPRAADLRSPPRW